MTARLPALVAVLVLGAALLAAVLVTTPWDPFGGAGVADRRVTGGAGGTPEWGRDFTAAEKARADAYRASVRPPAYLSLTAGLVAAAALGLTPLGARLVSGVARPLGAGWMWQVLLGGLVLLVVIRLVALPLDAWAESVSRGYGLSTRTWAGWAADVGRGFAISTAVTLASLLAVVALARAWPRLWWIPAAAGAAGLVVLLSFAYPLVVEPVFNKFTPMERGPLRDSLMTMARADGLRVDDVLVADASRRTATVNAYVSGFGATRRIVVYDTLLHTASAEEVRLVVAHEIAHASRRDVLRGTFLGALGAATGACLLAVLMSPGALRRAGAEAVGDPRSIAVVVLAVMTLSTLAGPVEALVSRRIEARADVHALALTRSPEQFIAMQRRLAIANLSDLDPPRLLYLLFASHPTAPQRIALARAWARAMGAPEPAPSVPAARDSAPAAARPPFRAPAGGPA